jgi:hypothetical protein
MSDSDHPLVMSADKSIRACIVGNVYVCYLERAITEIDGEKRLSYLSSLS